MKDDEISNYYEEHIKKSEKTLTELSTLIDMATLMQDTIVKKKNEIRKTILILATIIYVTLMTLFVIKFYAVTIINFDRFLQLSIFTFSFISGISAFSLFRIKTIINELKIERAAMQELMEVIFNLRKILKKNSFDLVDITILDLKLKRLRFY